MYEYINNTTIPCAIHIVGEHGMFEEFPTIDGLLHLFFGDEMVMLAMNLKTSWRPGGV